MGRGSKGEVMRYPFIYIYYLVVFLVYLYAHEIAGHYFVSWLSGISTSRMEIFWLQVGAIKIAPFAVNITGVKAVDASVLFRFSGGFVAGLLLATLAFVILKLYNKRTQSVFFNFRFCLCRLY